MIEIESGYGLNAATEMKMLRVARLLGESSYSNGAALAACFGALSADHLGHANDAGVHAMAEAGTVAVLLPGEFYFLREKQLPPVGLLRSHSVPIAIATDCNPGSSPSNSVLLMLNMDCTLFGLTPEEALAGITCYAALAPGMGSTHGTLEPGEDCGFRAVGHRRAGGTRLCHGRQSVRRRGEARDQGASSELNCDQLSGIERRGSDRGQWNYVESCY